MTFQAVAGGQPMALLRQARGGRVGPTFALPVPKRERQNPRITAAGFPGFPQGVLSDDDSLAGDPVLRLEFTCVPPSHTQDRVASIQAMVDLTVHDPVFIRKNGGADASYYRMLNRLVEGFSNYLLQDACMEVLSVPALNYHLAKESLSAEEGEDVPTPFTVYKEWAYTGAIITNNHIDPKIHTNTEQKLIQGVGISATWNFWGCDAYPLHKMFWVVRWMRADVSPFRYRETRESPVDELLLASKAHIPNHPCPCYVAQIVPVLHLGQNLPTRTADGKFGLRDTIITHPNGERQQMRGYCWPVGNVIEQKTASMTAMPTPCLNLNDLLVPRAVDAKAMKNSQIMVHRAVLPAY